jgi:Transposase, Mutator family
VIGVTVEGTRDIVGLWVGQGGEGAKYWAGVLTEVRNRGVEDVCIVVCDGLKGLPDAIGTVAARHRADLVSPRWRRPERFRVSSASAGEGQCRPTYEVPMQTCPSRR